MAPAENETTATPDAALVEGLRAGRPEALREIMEAQWAPLLAFARRILGGSGDAEDVVQDAFVRLWQRREGLRLEGSLRSLLYTIVRNASLDEIRKASRREKARWDGTPSPRTPYEDVQGAELQRMAAAAVSNLPAKRQEVFRLVREEGLSYQEVTEVMGLSLQTVANHMSLALADLRTALRPYMAPDRPASEESRRASSSGKSTED